MLFIHTFLIIFNILFLMDDLRILYKISYYSIIISFIILVITLPYPNRSILPQHLHHLKYLYMLF